MSVTVMALTRHRQDIITAEQATTNVAGQRLVGSVFPREKGETAEPLRQRLRMLHSAPATRERSIRLKSEPPEAVMIQDIAVDEILAACGDGETVTLKPGETLFREGDSAGAMYVVKQGTLRIVSGSAVLETVREGGLVGEMAIIEADMPRSATAIAGNYCELVEIDVPRFLSLVADNPAFSIAVLRVISRRLRVMNRRYRISTRSP
jgi:CRP/FNR family cyclic AMP-dependent transcriptional regulator